jgi:hypothetical protein
MDKPTTLKLWEEFSRHMVNTYLPRTAEKYGAGGMDLAPVTSQETRLWCILKYALRMMQGRGKQHDLEKIAHYAQMAWQHAQVPPAPEFDKKRGVWERVEERMDISDVDGEPVVPKIPRAADIGSNCKCCGEWFTWKASKEELPFSGMCQKCVTQSGEDNGHPD